MDANIASPAALILNWLEIVGPDEPLPKLPVASAVWRPEPDLETSATCWLTAEVDTPAFLAISCRVIMKNEQGGQFR